MAFPTHIWQRIGRNFMQTNEMCRKSCPILQIFYMYEIQIFPNVYHTFPETEETPTLSCSTIVSYTFP